MGAVAMAIELRTRLKDWAPRDHGGDSKEDHMRRMCSVGKLGSNTMYFNPVVCGFAAGLLWCFVIWAMVAQEDASKATSSAQAWVTNVWSWLYMSSQNVWILVLFYVMYKYGDLKFGTESDEPEFSNVMYFALIFSCGVANCLWYYTAEAMTHYFGGAPAPRWMDGQMWNSNTRAEHGMMITFFHWGPHGWIPYVVVGSMLSLMTYRRGFPMSMRFTLYPIIGEMCYGVIGDCVDVLSILCTVCGVCTALGLGAMQINTALVRLDRGTFHGRDSIGCDEDGLNCSGRVGIEMNTTTQIFVTIGITLMATASVVLGLKRGIAVLSKVAFVMSTFIFLCVLFMDETFYILNALVSSLGYYMWYLPKLSFHTDAWEELGKSTAGTGGAPDDRGGDKGWMNTWTVFYFAWWISWGPFVGTFLARISKGRKLGEFIAATLILPSLWSFTFLGTFGAAQIRISNIAATAGLTGNTPQLTYGLLANKSVIGHNVSGTWFPVPDGITSLKSLPMEDVLFEHVGSYGGEGFACFMTVITLFTVVLYFVTSSDSASFVVDIIAANGAENPPVPQRIFWAMTEGVTACALLASSGMDPDKDPKAALHAVQSLPIILGLPFSFLLFWMCQGLLITCREEVGDIDVGRRHFGVFILNIEPSSLLSIVMPPLPLAKVSPRVWKGSPVGQLVMFSAIWFSMILFLILTAADTSFAYLAAAAYFIFALSAAAVRASVRAKLGISGDMLSDACACCFALPCAIGQMRAEDIGNAAKVHEIGTVSVLGSASPSRIATGEEDGVGRDAADGSEQPAWRAERTAAFGGADSPTSPGCVPEPQTGATEVWASVRKVAIKK